MPMVRAALSDSISSRTLLDIFVFRFLAFLDICHLLLCGGADDLISCDAVTSMVQGVDSLSMMSAKMPPKA